MEIFLWYFEQKGIDNPERFLAGSANNENPLNTLMLQALMGNLMNKLQNKTQENTNPQEKESSKDEDESTELLELIKEVGEENLEKEELNEI